MAQTSRRPRFTRIPGEGVGENYCDYTIRYEKKIPSITGGFKFHYPFDFLYNMKTNPMIATTTVPIMLTLADDDIAAAPVYANGPTDWGEAEAPVPVAE
jgi:hypothetical protein